MATENELSIEQQMLAVLKEKADVLDRINKLQGNSANINSQLNQSLQSNIEKTEKSASVNEQLTNSLKNSKEGVDELAKALGRKSKAAEDAEKRMKFLQETLSNGLSAGFQSVTSALGIFTNGLKAMGGIIKGALGVVVGFFDELMGLAADYYNNAAGEMAAANRAIQESFGELYKYQGAAVREMRNQITATDSMYKKSGVSIYNTLGSVGEQFQFVTDIAKSLGNQFISMNETILDSIDRFAMLNKAMEISNESYKQMLSTAQASGANINEVMDSMAVTAVGLSKQFGVSAKIIGKNMDEMVKDFNHFGKLGPKALGAVATYAIKLGIEIKSLAGLMDTFDTFDGAAASAGKLAEAFGMNVDVLKMMNAENPAERMDELRKAFQATGKSVGDLTRHEMKLLSEAMGGMDANELQKALSINADQLGYDDFADAAEEAAEKISPEQAMKDLADAITKLNKSIAQLGKGPLQSFINGFTYAVNMGENFRSILKSVGEWLKVFQEAGKKVGAMFDKIILGSSKVKGFIDSMFNIDAANGFMDKVVGTFERFFTMLETDPAKAMENFLNDMWDGFANFINGTGNGSGVGGFGEMLKGMLEGAFKFIADKAPMIIREISKYLVIFAQVLSGELEGKGPVSDALQGGLGGAFVEAVSNIWDAVKSDLIPALGAVLREIGKAILPLLTPILTGIFVISMTKSIVTALISSLISNAVTAGFKKFSVGFGAKTENALNGPGAQNTSKGLQNQNQSVGAFKDLIDKLFNLNPMQIVKAGFNLLILATFASGAMLIFIGAMKIAASMLETVSWDSLGKALISTIVGIVAMGAMAFALQNMKEINWALAINTGLALAAFAIIGLGGIAAAMAATFAFLDMINYENFAEKLLLFGVGLMATMTMAGLALAASTYLNTATLGPMLQTMLIGAAFVATGVVLMVGAFWLLQKVTESSSLDISSLALTMTGLALAIAALAGLVYATISLVPVLTTGLPAVTIGMVAAGVAIGLIVLSLPLLVKGFNSIVSEMATVDLLGLGKAFVAIASAFGTVLTIVGVGIGLFYMAPMMLFALGGLTAGVGFVWTAGKLITEMVSAVANVNIKDPERLEQVMGVIGSVVQMITDIGSMAINAMKLKASSKFTSDVGIQNAFADMNDFVTNTVGHVTSIIDKLEVIMQKYDEKTLRKLEPMAKVLASVAQLISAMASPLQMLSQVRGEISKTNGGLKWLWAGETETETNKEGAIAETVKGMLKFVDALIGEDSGGALFKLIDVMMSKAQNISDPKRFIKQADAMVSITSAAATMLNSVGKMSDIISKNGDLDWKKLEVNFLDLSQFMVDVMPHLISTISILSTENDLKVTEKHLANLGNVFTLLGTIYEKMDEGLGKMFSKESSVEKLLTQWDTMKKPSQVVGEFIAEIDSIAGQLNNMNLDAGEFKITSATNLLGYDGDKTFTIKPEAVNLNLSLSVKMDAEELAVNIYKNNKTKSDGFFVTTSKAGTTLLEPRYR